jgi:hypothetical protein
VRILPKSWGLRWTIAISAVLLAACAFTAFWYLSRTAEGSNDAAPAILTIVVMAIALATLYFTANRPAELQIDGFDEAGLSDLIFFIYEGVPRDFLLQQHVAVANIGHRQAVLTSIHISAFLASDGTTVELPQVPVPLGGAIYSVRHIYLEDGRGGTAMHRELIHPPFGIAPHDVVVIRFRCRRSLAWSQEDDSLETVRAWHTAVAAPITAAALELTYRRAGKTVRKQTSVPLNVEQQREYADLLESLTRGFTTWPNVEQQVIPPE